MATAEWKKQSNSAARTAKDIFDRTPPHNFDAEKGVLGSMIVDPERIDDVLLVIRESDFYSEPNQRLFRHLTEIRNEGKRPDETLLFERLREHGDFEFIGGIPYVAELVNAVPYGAKAEEYAEIVRSKSMLRSLIRAGSDILNEAYESSGDAREILGKAEQRIFSILDAEGSTQIAEIHDVLQRAFDRIEARMSGEYSDMGLHTGFREFNELTGGLRNGELAILAGRPSMGKTALAMNIVDHVAGETGKPVLFVSLEMDRLELADRMLSARSRVNGHKIRNGMITSSDQSDLVKASAELSKAPLFIDDSPSRTMPEIAATSRRLKHRRDGLSLIVIDYLQLIEPEDPDAKRQEQVARIARRLKGLAREVQLPVLCLAQLNRQAEATKDNRPRLSHLRESGAIEQDADLVMFIHREEYYHSPEDVDALELAGKADLIVAKHRNGPTGDVKLRWQKDYTRFEDEIPEYQQIDDAFFDDAAG